MASTARAICGSSRRTARATVRIFPVQRTQNFERRFPVKPARTRVPLFCPRWFQGAPRTLDNYSGSERAAAGLEGFRLRIVPRELSGGGLAGGQAQALEDGVVQRRAHLADLFIGARGIHAIGQQHDEQLSFRIDPERRAGKARVPEAPGRKIAA